MFPPKLRYCGEQTKYRGPINAKETCLEIHIHAHIHPPNRLLIRGWERKIKVATHKALRGTV